MISSNLLELFMLGFIIWYATGIDDAIIFGGIMAGARTRLEKIQATLGLLTMYTIMVCMVAFMGHFLTSFFGIVVYGPLKVQHILQFLAIAFVCSLAGDAWSEGSEEDDSDDVNGMKGIEAHVPESTYERLIWKMSQACAFSRIAQDAFKGFGLNCTDDITVNTSNLLGREVAEMVAYLSGNAIGVASMILIVWLLHGKLQHFAEHHGSTFNKVRAIAMGFAAFLIFQSAVMSAWKMGKQSKKPVNDGLFHD